MWGSCRRGESLLLRLHILNLPVTAVGMYCTQKGPVYALSANRWPPCCRPTHGIWVVKCRPVAFSPRSNYIEASYPPLGAPNGNASNQIARSRGTCPKDGAGSVLAEQATRSRPILAPSGQANEGVIRYV